LIDYCLASSEQYVSYIYDKKNFTNNKSWNATGKRRQQNEKQKILSEQFINLIKTLNIHLLDYSPGLVQTLQ